MDSCYICSETLKLPVSLPCGHVFCSQCILITIQTVKPLTPMHRCPTCKSWYNVAPLDTKTVPPNLRPFVTPSVRPLHMKDVMRSERKTESICDPASPNPSWSSNESSTQISAVRSSYPSNPSSSEMVRLRAENHALRNHCSMWRRRAEAHGEANLNLLKFARAIRDQASQIARDRNELEQRCFMLKRELDGECSYSDEMQKFGKSAPAMVPDSGVSTKQIGDRGSHHPAPSPPRSGVRPPSRPGLDSDQSRKRPRRSIEGE